MLEQSSFTLPPEYSSEQANALEPLDPYDNEVLAYVEQHWYVKRRLLTPATASKLMSVDKDKLEIIWAKSSFQHALRTKGIVTDGRFVGAITSKQIAAVNMVLLRQDGRSLREKLKEVGVTPVQWNGWLSQPEFIRYMEAKSGIDFKGATTTAMRVLLNEMESGDLAATKLYLEIVGIYNNKVQVDVNINNLMDTFVEIVAKYVDEETMESIAGDLDRAYGLQVGRADNVLDMVSVISPASAGVIEI